MTTIVSAFIANGNTHRSTKKYLEYIKPLLNTTASKIIFLEKKIIKQLKDFQNNKTIFIPFEREELSLFSFIDKDIKIPTIHSEKNTLAYLMIQINKTEWIRKAIELNPFETKQFMWVDCGIYHIFNDATAFSKSIEQSISHTYPNIRIASIWTINPNISQSALNPTSPIFDLPMWYFAGGVFGGHKDSLLLFADRVRNKVREFITAGRLTWEINIWYALYFKNKELFDIYYCDHNKSILENY